MSTISVNTEPPFEFVRPDDYERETEEREAGVDRARYLKRKHNLPEIAAYGTAFAQMGWGANKTARAIGSTEGTVSNHLGDVEDEFGLQARVSKAPEDRTGPLDEGTFLSITGPEEQPTVRDDVPEAADSPGDSRAFVPAMVEREQWLIRDGKVPQAPWASGAKGKNASGGDDPTDELLWTDFGTADEYVSMLPTPKWGFYFMLVTTGPLAAIDLDECRDPETGEIDDRAREIIDRADAFTEISPSGDGVHIYLRGSIPKDLTNGTRGVELYDNSQITVTGNKLPGTPDEAPERQGLLDELADEYMVEASKTEHRGEYDGGGEDFSPFDALRVTDVYPGLETDTNVPHPEHGTTSDGGNFRITESRGTATCWRGEHQHGQGEGCGLNAHHLLAMRVTGSDNCAAIRERWADDDELVFETWLHTIENEDHIELDPSPPPWRALRHIADEVEIGGLEDGGEAAQVAFRIICRAIRIDHGVPVEFDDVPEMEVA